MHYIFREMELSIYNENDKVLFKEVVTCYNAGAYRAAFVMTWIMIAESLKEKLKSMANKDGALQKFIKKMEEGKINSIDSELITESQKVGIIDEIEMVKLKYIQTLRNRYAHPNSVSPHGDEVISALRVGIYSVLIKKPLLRHGYIKNLISKMESDYHFIEDDKDFVADFTKSIVHRISEDAHVFVLRESLKKLDLMDKDKTIDLRFKLRIFNFINIFLEEVGADLNEEKWNIEFCINEYPLQTAALLINEKLFSTINDDMKIRVISSSLEPIRDGKTGVAKPYSINLVNKLYKENLFPKSKEEHLYKKLTNILETYPYKILISASITFEELYSRVIADFKSANWYRQKDASEYIWSVKSEWLKVSGDKQIILGRNILQAADGKSDGARALIYKIFSENIESNQNVVYGILLEIVVNEKDIFRFKGIEFFKDTISNVVKFDNKIAMKILSEVKTKILKSSIDSNRLQAEVFKTILEDTSNVKNKIDVNDNELIIYLENFKKEIECKQMQFKSYIGFN